MAIVFVAVTATASEEAFLEAIFHGSHSSNGVGQEEEDSVEKVSFVFCLCCCYF